MDSYARFTEWAIDQVAHMIARRAHADKHIEGAIRDVGRRNGGEGYELEGPAYAFFHGGQSSAVVRYHNVQFTDDEWGQVRDQARRLFIEANGIFNVGVRVCRRGAGYHGKVVGYWFDEEYECYMYSVLWDAPHGAEQSYLRHDDLRGE